MYNDHPELFTPPDDTVLWRYMDFTKFVSLLETQALFFCRADRLGDPFEGSISSVTPPAAPPDLRIGPVDVHQIDFRQVVRMARVNCWHAGKFESAAMWRLYARDTEGVAIRTTFDRLKESLGGKQELCASAVQYVDYKVDAIPCGNGLLPLVHKRISFKHEQEVRVIFLQNSHNAAEGDSGGCYIDVDLATLISEIVVAPFAQDWFLELVGSLASRAGFVNRVRTSVLSEVPNFTAQFLTQKAE